MSISYFGFFVPSFQNSSLINNKPKNIILKLTCFVILKNIHKLPCPHQFCCSMWDLISSFTSSNSFKVYSTSKGKEEALTDDFSIIRS